VGDSEISVARVWKYMEEGEHIYSCVYSK
jgi:hypothetical protein